MLFPCSIVNVFKSTVVRYISFVSASSIHGFWAEVHVALDFRVVNMLEVSPGLCGFSERSIFSEGKSNIS